MNWSQVSFRVDRFTRVCDDNLAELRRKHTVIQKCELEKDYGRGTLEKEEAKKLINQIQVALQDLLELRSQLDDNVKERFDARIEDTRSRITQTIALIMPRLTAKSLNSREDFSAPSMVKESIPKGSTEDSFMPTGSTNPFDSNYFEDCFNQDRMNEATEYEDQLQLEAEKSFKDQRLAELKLKAEQARMDAEATKKLNSDIEDLSQIMVDLAQLVHCQNELVDSIEDQVERTVHDVNTGHRELKKAVQTKQARVPFYAAAVGSLAAGGPVAIAAGSAVAGVAAAVGGAIAGLYGGRLIKKQVANENS